MSQNSDDMDGTRVRMSKQDTEVAAKAERRRFSAEYKLRILEEAAAVSNGGKRVLPQFM